MMKLGQFETAGLRGARDRIREAGFESVPRWYLVQCRARQEERALEHLERQGFECYRPLYERERIRRGRRHLASVALFPGYLFIRLDRIHDNWLPICSTRGVIQIVRFNEYPLPVSDEIIEHIRGRIASELLREPYLKAGERVVITKGTFSGIEAIFVASEGDERAMLLLNILHSEQTLSFPIASVRKLEKKRGPSSPTLSTSTQDRIVSL
jgi:transcriptional antiterminator RfaH